MIGEGYGKVILFGEHFVVHGAPALASGLPDIKTVLDVEEGEWNLDPQSTEALSNITKALGLDKSFRIKWIEQVPPRANLGSSAAMAVAFTRALDKLYNLGLDDQKVFELSFEAERVFHGKPSGVDGACATYGRPILYQKGKEIQLLPSPGLHLLIISARKKDKSTKELVEQFQHIKGKTPFFSRLWDEYMFIFESALQAIEEKNVQLLGRLMDYNHSLLSYFDLTTPEIEEIREQAKAYGALGAKLTGAGKGGNIIALFPSKELALEAQEKLPWKSYYSFI
ncbi:MAG: mevalonate kinase [Candidatus Micrarchaeota archaeon]|nr:mevalonate kinase [Candidatus Micrarchaeota archaeon]